MESLINLDTLWCLIPFLPFTLGIAASVKARLDAFEASKRSTGHARRELPAQVEWHCTHLGGTRSRFGAGAMASELTREGCRRPQRSAVHGKE